MRAVAAAESHAQIEGCVRAQAQRSCEWGGWGDGALTKLTFATGIVKQLHDVCARRAAEGACKSCRVVARVELRRRLVLLGIRAREDHAARTTLCTAMQHPQIATALATASKNKRFVRKACPARPAFHTLAT